MCSSRAESQSSQYGRRRSNTAQSIFKSLPPPSASMAEVKLGDSKSLITWVHDPKESPVVIFNHIWWPGINEGDFLKVTPTNSDSGFLFIVPKDDDTVKHQLQISIPRPIADRFVLRNNGEVTVIKVNKDTCRVDYVEFTFQDQYLGRNEMWRLCQHLVGQCVYLDQDISFIGIIGAKISCIYVDGKKVTAGYVTSTTKAIYRSLSAKITIFIQVCREFWEFATDGERYYEKIVHSFLPALYTKWKDAGTNHIVTIVLVSRVFYDQSEIDYAAGPLRRDEDGRFYKDFYKVITDLEVLYDWKPALVSLKDSFWQFQRDILLDHHYHQATLKNPSSCNPPPARLVGTISFAHDGPILEALNLGLNPTETHYIDRSLSLTGACTIIITPGTGYFRVSKQLLRLTTTRLLDQGFAIDLVSLAKPPLHQSPIFCFQGTEPELRLDRDAKSGHRALDPLWGGDDEPKDSVGKEKTTFWWEPFWMSVSFWDKQLDLPMREDRFVARAKMYEIQSLGLLDHDVVSSIEIPFLPHHSSVNTPVEDIDEEFGHSLSKPDADRFDLDIFALKRESRAATASRNSITSSGSGTMMSSSYRSNEKRSTQLSSSSRMIPPIEESPHTISAELLQDETHLRLSMFTTDRLSTSPSQSSMTSIRSARSTTTSTKGGSDRKRKSKFTPSWLFNQFRSGISEPQTSAVSASAVTSPVSASTPTLTPIASSTTITSLTGLKTAIPRVPKPVNIEPRASPRNSVLSRTMEDEIMLPRRGSLNRNSPIGTPPRDDTSFGRRRSIQYSSGTATFSSSFPSRSNPSFPKGTVPYTQASLARRWQHLFPEPLTKKEIKWKAMVNPPCLPLTVEQFPTRSELESSFDVFSYGFVVDPPEMRSFLVRPPTLLKGGKEEVRRAWAGAVMREMCALRLAQGFQFVLRCPSGTPGGETYFASAEFDDQKQVFRKSHAFGGEDEDLTPIARGAADVLNSTYDPVYLSMSNEIHRISYTGDSIQVKRYVRRMPVSHPIQYQCLIWPKLGEGYTELKTSFVSYGLENYGWNRLDMLIAGYETQFNESVRYWRTRFVVIPTAEPPLSNVGPNGEKLNDEEIRLVGMDKLAEMFSRVRWQPPDEKSTNSTSALVRFLPTDLGPSASVLDEHLMSRLDEIHSVGPLKKKMKSEKDIGEMGLSAIAKAMLREDDGVIIKDYRWHGKKYGDSFIGADFVSWLVREFRDVSSREQALDVGVRLQAQGLFGHSAGRHGFLDGHYFYQLKGEYATPSTPRGWFRSSSRYLGEEPRSYYPSSTRVVQPVRRMKKRLILSQSVVVDIDPNKRSDQAESLILHHDIIHNPATCFHFELHWIGTTARCIDDQLRQWSRTIERYGLKLVEAYVGQICDIRERNPFQSCFPVRLAIPPPIVPDMERRVPEGTSPKHYFECAMLRKFGFVLDIESADTYSERVEVIYSYRRYPFKYSQWVHRTGVVFAQVLGGSQGFLFLTNRLMAPGRMGTSLKSKEQRPGDTADEIMFNVSQACNDTKTLNAFYDEEINLLPQVIEDPPPLKI